MSPARPFYLTHPEALSVDAEIIDQRGELVRLDRSPFFPGGGGQSADRGQLVIRDETHAIVGYEHHDGAPWIKLDKAPRTTRAFAVVDTAFRRLMSELHTASHLANTAVYHRFDGALATGVQMSADGTVRIDFDLPTVTAEQLQDIEQIINRAIAADHSVEQRYVPEAQLERERGLVRSKFVSPPPQHDGQVRLVEIGDFDRQACGGTHVIRTGLLKPLRILKVENKGRQNRRIRFAFAA